MACLLRIPSNSGKGVVVFTTPERDSVISGDPQLRAAIEALKNRWLIGLHHNWHDHAFVRDHLFDFSMAGEDDLIGDPVPLVTLDACNFVPPDFHPGGEKFWDLLYVARPVFFKGFDRFLDSVRELYDSGRRDRVLCVCAMPPYDPAEEETVLYGLEDVYLERFSREERRLFTLLALRYDYPFPLDLPTLAHLYRSSRVFAHFAPDERRCRVAAYAWASGLPVVGTPAVGSLLPEPLRKPPAFHEVRDPSQYADRIATAVDASADPVEHSGAAAYFAPANAARALTEQLDEQFPGESLGDESGYSLSDLGIRLGRHHGISSGPNRVPMTVAELVAVLGTNDRTVDEVAASAADPEMALAEQSAAGPAAAHDRAPEPRRPKLRVPWRR